MKTFILFALLASQALAITPAEYFKIEKADFGKRLNKAMTFAQTPKEVKGIQAIQTKFKTAKDMPDLINLSNQLHTLDLIAEKRRENETSGKKIQN